MHVYYSWQRTVVHSQVRPGVYWTQVNFTVQRYTRFKWHHALCLHLTLLESNKLQVPEVHKYRWTLKADHTRCWSTFKTPNTLTDTYDARMLICWKWKCMIHRFLYCWSTSCLATYSISFQDLLDTGSHINRTVQRVGKISVTNEDGGNLKNGS